MLTFCIALLLTEILEGRRPHGAADEAERGDPEARHVGDTLAAAHSAAPHLKTRAYHEVKVTSPRSHLVSPRLSIFAGKRRKTAYISFGEEPPPSSTVIRLSHTLLLLRYCC